MGIFSRKQGALRCCYIIAEENGMVYDVGLEYREDTVEFAGAQNSGKILDEDIDGIGITFGMLATIGELWGSHELNWRAALYTGDFEEAPGITVGYAWHFLDNFLAPYL